MRVLVTENAIEMSKKAAALIAEEVKENPEALLALSTGSSPIGCYEELVRLHKERNLDFSKIWCMNMDEYVGLDREHPQGYYYFMYHYLYQHVNINLERTFGPDAVEPDSEAAARAFDERITQQGGIDLILLGIGRDGHIAFNMPEDKLTLATHVQKLSDATIKDNARFFESIEEVPTKAMTLGVENIFKSKKVILIASGCAKSEIMGKFINSKVIDTKIPATLLKLHPDITVIVDRDAAKNL